LATLQKGFKVFGPDAMNFRALECRIRMVFGIAAMVAAKDLFDLRHEFGVAFLAQFGLYHIRIKAWKLMPKPVRYGLQPEGRRKRKE
jgi:hypothetical protein